MRINGAIAIDDKDGDITQKIVITGKVDTKKEGIYIITYTVEDSSKNVATITRKVIVKKEETQPGQNSGQNPGENPGQNPGENPEQNPEQSPGQNPGENPGENPGQNTEPTPTPAPTSIPQ